MDVTTLKDGKFFEADFSKISLYIVFVYISEQLTYERAQGPRGLGLFQITELELSEDAHYFKTKTLKKICDFVSFYMHRN